MSFLPAAWFRRARAATEEWNRHHCDSRVPWEWVEEAIIARHNWQEHAEHAAHDAEEHRLRFQEFSRKLPLGLVQELWPGL